MTDKVVTFGCRLNIYESEVIKNALEQSGNKNALVFNTCSVTKEAERQAQQAIRKARRENPDVKIYVTGCAAQIAPEKYASMDEVDFVLGNEEKLVAENYMQDAESNNILVNDIMSVKETASHLVSSFDGKSRAFIQIQNGCNHRCTFCIIPYGRGNNRSVPVGKIVEQVNLLIDQGYNEIVFTGVDISDYGKDLPASPTLGQMIKRVLNLAPRLTRLRLSSIDVAEIDDELREMLKTEKRLMPHVHISLQAGDDMILKRMKRRHNRQQVIEFCNDIRSVRPETSFGADIIAGFPTENEEMFLNTLNLVDEAQLQFLHVFPYSEREGTPAARMPPVEKSIRKERAKKIREAGQRQLDIFNKKYVGDIREVIIENDGFGKSDNFLKIKINDKISPGTICKVKITDISAGNLIGEVI